MEFACKRDHNLALQCHKAEKFEVFEQLLLEVEKSANDESLTGKERLQISAILNAPKLRNGMRIFKKIGDPVSARGYYAEDGRKVSASDVKDALSVLCSQLPNAAACEDLGKF